MSKYDGLWQYVALSGADALELGFDEIGTIAGVPLDHSFLNAKKELEGFGYRVEKISMKKQVVFIRRREDA